MGVLNQRELLAGATDTMPLVFGMVPFGLAYGIVAQSTGLTVSEAMAMSMIVFAGAAQFVSLPMFAEGASMALIAATTLLVNLRHLLMGVSLAPHVGRRPLWQKAALFFAMTDETYAVTISRTERARYSASYQLGSNAAGYAAWLASSLAGLFLGAHISDPLAWGLDFAMPATFLALLVPRLKDKASLAVFAVSALVSVAVMVAVPGKWYIMMACLAAVGVGAALEGADVDAN